MATNGSNANNGAASSTPLLTLQYAEGKTNPGDAVYAMAGTYTANAGNDVVLINRSGTISAPITYTAYSGTRPVIDTSNGWYGFEIVGDAQSHTSISAPTT